MAHNTHIENRVTIILFAVLAVMVVAFLTTNPPQYVHGLPTAEMSAEDVHVGDQVLVDVVVSSVSDLMGVELALSYNDSSLSLNNIQQGPFLSSDDAETFFPENNVLITDNAIQDVFLVRLSSSGVSGSGTLFSFGFEAIASGDNAIKISKVTLVNSEAEEISNSSASLNISITSTNSSEDTTPPTTPPTSPPTTPTSNSGGGGGGILPPSEQPTSPSTTNKLLFEQSQSLGVTRAQAQFPSGIDDSASLRIDFVPSDDPQAPSQTDINTAVLHTTGLFIIENGQALLGDVEFSFSLEESWFASQGTDINELVVFGYSEGLWQEISLQEVSVNEGVVSLVATGTGINRFAVGARTTQQQEEATSVTPPTQSEPSTVRPESVSSWSGLRKLAIVLLLFSLGIIVIGIMVSRTNPPELTV